MHAAFIPIVPIFILLQLLYCGIFQQQYLEQIFPRKFLENHAGRIWMQ